MVSSGSSLGSATLRLTADGGDLEKGIRSAGQKAGELGRVLTGLGAAFLAPAALGIRAFGQFEKRMANVQAVSGATGAEFQALTDIAKELGRTTEFTASQAAEALGFLAMAGINSSDSISALPNVLNLATAGSLELANAADIVTNVMSGFGISADDVGKATDVLVTGFTSANTDLQQLGEAFTYAGPVAKAAGLSFEETSAALALLGNAGIQASMAGTTLRGSITRLLNPSNQAADALARLGVTATDSAGELLPFNDIIAQFEGTGLSASDAMLIFGQRAGPGMLELVRQGSGALQALTREMELSGGTAEQIAKDKLDTFLGQLTKLASAGEGLALVIGEGIVPVLRPLAETLTNVVQRSGRLGRSKPDTFQCHSDRGHSPRGTGGWCWPPIDRYRRNGSRDRSPDPVDCWSEYRDAGQPCCFDRGCDHRVGGRWGTPLQKLG